MQKKKAYVKNIFWYYIQQPLILYVVCELDATPIMRVFTILTSMQRAHNHTHIQLHADMREVQMQPAKWLHWNYLPTLYGTVKPASLLRITKVHTYANQNKNVHSEKS